jgi:plastocyanin
MHPRLAVLVIGCLVLAAPLAMAGGGHAEAEAESGVHSPDLAPGQSWSHTFTDVGRFDYHCHPHPWMLAGINIVASTGRPPVNHTIEIIEPEGKDFDQWTWSPAVATIEAGDTVTWVNQGSVVHVVQETTAEHLEHVGTVGAPAVQGGAGGDTHGHGGSFLDFPTQGWAWIGIALVGGVLIGRKWSRVQASAAAPSAPEAAPKSSEPVASAAKEPET